MVDDSLAGLRLLALVAQSRRPQVTSPAGGGSPATHRRWGRRPAHGARGAGMQGCGPPLAEPACRTTAMGMADCVSPAFAQHPGDPPSHRHGPTSKVECAIGTSQAASTSSAAAAPNEPRLGRGSWRWSAPLPHRSHRGGRRPPNDGPWSVPPRYSQDGRGELGG